MTLTITHRYSTRSKTKAQQVQRQQDKSSTDQNNNNDINSKQNTDNNKETPAKRKFKAEKPENNKKKQKVTKKQTITSKKGKEKIVPSSSSSASTSPSTSTTTDITTTNNNNENDDNKFTSLPPEILRNILSKLVIKDLYNLALSNKKSLNIVQCQPIWGDILTKNHKSGQKRHDNMFLVLRDSTRICDLCHLYTKPSGSGGAILTSFTQYKDNNNNGNDNNNYKIRVCLNCRRNNFSHHPENLLAIAKLEFPEDVNNEETDIENIDRKITKSRAKFVFKLNDTDMHTIHHTIARNPHGRAFAPMLLYNIPEVLTIALRKHGGYNGLLEERKKTKISAEKRAETVRLKEEKHQRESEERQKVLVEKLAEKGLQLRGDSVLCDRYIDRGIGNPDSIVEVMKEMDWYYKNTNYSSTISSLYEDKYYYENLDFDFDFGGCGRRGRRGGWYHSDELDEDNEAEKIQISNSAKSHSLRQWVESRTIKNNFQEPVDDKDDDKRPPASLWSKINSILKEEIIKIGFKYLSEDIKQSKEYFSRGTRRSQTTLEMVKSNLNNKTIDSVQVSNSKINTFGALVSNFYGDNQSKCYSAIAYKVKIVR